MNHIHPIAFDPASERYVNLSTYRRSGSHVDTPVWLAQAGASFYLFSAGNSGKVKRIRANPQAKIAPCNMRGKVKGPWIEVTARIVEEAGAKELAYKALHTKYGWQMALLDFFSGLSGKKQKRAVIELKLY